jgi:Xaa-Pro aminopeptidase
MTSEIKFKTNLVISDKEMQRRWQVVRQEMKKRSVDFLVMQNSHSIMHGCVRWFTDLKVGDGYPFSVLFPVDDEMTVITHGPRDQMPLGPIFGQPLRGIKKHITIPVVLSLSYGRNMEADHLIAEMSGKKNPTVGLVGMPYISSSLYKQLTTKMSSAKFEDWTDIMDGIRVIKSEEELGFVKNTCLLEDALWQFALTQIKPGVSNSTVKRNVMRQSMDMGVDVWNVGIGSAPAGQAARMSPEDRVLKEGDQVVMLLETDGPGGFWGELARVACIGKIPAPLQEQFDIACQAQKVSVDLLKPGIPAARIMKETNAFLESKGYPGESRIYAHGQGYDMVEVPCLDTLEPMIIQANMFVAVHPEAKSEKAHGWVCDGFVVKPSGPAERLHTTPQKIFVV